MLTKSDNKIFNALSGIKTKRRIALTGSPIQNNLLEYFRMVNWVKPGILGNSEANFEKEYVNPIISGLASDASAYAVRTSNEASKMLHNMLSPYVQRKDASVLRKDLPSMQQVVLHVRQSKTQARLYRAFQAYRKRRGITNFFKIYQMQRPLHNHPGTLLMSGEVDESEGSDCKQDGNSITPTETEESVFEEAPDVPNGTKDVTSNSKTSARMEIVELSSDSETADDEVDDLELTNVGDTVSSEGDRNPSCDADETTTVSVDTKDGSAVTDLVTDREGGDAEIAGKVSAASSAPQAAGLPPSGRKTPDECKEQEWWRKTADRHGGVEILKEVEQGYKVVLLLHILMEAQALGDKVLVFTQCLKTLDFIEYVLGLDDWTEHVPSLASSFPSGKRGAWKKNLDYLRIDGQTQFSERGELIARFNDEKNSSSPAQKTDSGDQVKAFLLSAKVSRIVVLSASHIISHRRY